MHEYTVEFRILGDSLEPSIVANELGLEPSLIRRSEIGTSPVKVIWGFDGLAPDEPRAWESLEEGLRFLLSQLRNKKAALTHFKDRYEVIFWCGHFQSSFDGGPTLSADILQELGEFGVPLFIDNYFSPMNDSSGVSESDDHYQDT